jgi:hypothetical protein
MDFFRFAKVFPFTLSKKKAACSRIKLGFCFYDCVNLKEVVARIHRVVHGR